MRYVGGKTRIARWVADNILSISGSRNRYIEPFVGSGAVFVEAAPMFDVAECGDAHEDLILLWRAISDGWIPPEYVSREEYLSLKSASPSAMRGFVGYGSSFGGKWFGGYVDRPIDVRKGRNYAMPSFAGTASRSLVKAAPVFRNAVIRHCSYKEWSVKDGDVVYCDPPYRGTIGYQSCGGVFDSDDFWRSAASWSDQGALVVVSESSAPDGWKIISERDRRAMLRVAVGVDNQVRTERIYVRA